MERHHFTITLRSLSERPAPAIQPAHDPTSEDDPEPEIECPFHTIMRHLAGTAVQQHILHLEGELLPRPDLVNALESWQQLYRLVRTHVCPATREAPLLPADIDALVDTALPRLLADAAPPQVSARLRRRLTQCASVESSRDCPLSLVPLPHQSQE